MRNENPATITSTLFLPSSIPACYHFHLFFTIRFMLLCFGNGGCMPEPRGSEDEQSTWNRVGLRTAHRKKT